MDRRLGAERDGSPPSLSRRFKRVFPAAGQRGKTALQPFDLLPFGREVVNAELVGHAHRDSLAHALFAQGRQFAAQRRRLIGDGRSTRNRQCGGPGRRKHDSASHLICLHGCPS